MNALNPHREAAPRISTFDETDKRGAGYDAWSVWLNASSLALRPDQDFGEESKAYMRKTVDVLTRRLEEMK